MVVLIGKAALAKLLAFCDKNSWLFGMAGVLLAAVGGVITNATVGLFLKEACGVEGKACFHGVIKFLFLTTEGEMIVTGGMFTCISIAVSYLDKAKIDQIRNDNIEKDEQIAGLNSLNLQISEDLNKRSINTFEVFSLYLKHISGELSLGIEDRVSIYTISEDYFFLIGRFSENHSYTKTGREYYPRYQGVIEAANEKNWAQIDLLCSYEGNSAKKRKYADEQLKKSRIPAQIAHGFRMKSRCYRSLAIRRGGLGLPLAIVCIESTKRSGLNHITRPLLETRFAQLAVLIQALEHHVPSMDNAMSQGL